MDLGLQQKRALVTGSTAGIGFATARILAVEGVRVILNGRTAERVNAAVERLRQELPQASVNGVAADVGRARGHWGRIVFVSSESAIQIPKEMIHYGMTKTRVTALSPPRPPGRRSGSMAEWFDRLYKLSQMARAGRTAPPARKG